jgi:GNAT superfamily N-acetyltransferase
MHNLIVQEAVSSDLDALVEFGLSLQSHCEKSNGAVWKITEEGKRFLKQKLEDTLKDSNSRVFVARMSEGVIGFASGQVSSREDYLPNRVALISRVYVNEKYRRQGVGKRLVKELCRFFNSMNAEQVTLRYIVGNREAERFWAKLGFRPIITTASITPRELNANISI